MRITHLLAPFAILSTFGLFMGWLFGVYTIDQGERGVILRNGAVIGTAEPGLGFKNPFLESVEKISVQQETVRYEQVQAYSRDQQTATLQVSVTFSVPPTQVADVYSNFGSIEAMQGKIIDRQVNEQVEIVFGQFNAITAVQDRARLSSDISTAIKRAVTGPVAINSVQVENIDFSDAYEKSIEQRMQAEVEVQKLRQNAEREKVQAEITVTQAQATADSQKATATAEAYATEVKALSQAKAIRLAGDAEAEAIRAKGAALRENASLVELTTAERWNGVLPATMVPGAALPFISVK